MTGLVHKNGQLAEAYSYGAYGDVGILSYHLHDVDRSGEVKKIDGNLVLAEQQAEPVNGPTSDPVLDIDFDGDCDSTDWGRVLVSMSLDLTYHLSEVPLRTGGIGNPYFFAGRQRHFLDDVTTAGTNDNKHIQYNRARHYDPRHGRWLQRDPAGSVDGANLYEYVRSRAQLLLDPFGALAHDTCQFLESRIFTSWQQVYSRILSQDSDLYIPQPAPPLTIAYSLAAYERAYWIRTLRNVYKCRVGCSCVLVWGTRAYSWIMTESTPNRDAMIGAKGLRLDTTIGLNALATYYRSGPLGKAILGELKKDIAAGKVHWMTDWVDVARNYAPKPSESNAGSPLPGTRPSTPPLGIKEGRVDCELQFPDFIHDIWGYECSIGEGLASYLALSLALPYSPFKVVRALNRSRIARETSFAKGDHLTETT